MLEQAGQPEKRERLRGRIVSAPLSAASNCCNRYHALSLFGVFRAKCITRAAVAATYNLADKEIQRIANTACKA